MTNKSDPLTQNNQIQGNLISHLDQYVISGPISQMAEPWHWRTVPYQADGFDGVLLGCGEATCPAPVRLRLDATGPHRIWLGIYAWRSGAIRVRLSNDLSCTEISTPSHNVIDAPVLHEILWKADDLTGQNLWLEGAYVGSPRPGALAYLRLEPLEALPTAAPSPRVWRGMCITNDGCGVFRSGPHYRPQDLLETLEMIPDSSCMRSLMWGNGNADSCNYPTRVGNPLFLQKWQDPHVAGDGAFGCPHARQWQEPGWDSLRLIRDYTRTRNWSGRSSFTTTLSGGVRIGKKIRSTA